VSMVSGSVVGQGAASSARSRSMRAAMAPPRSVHRLVGGLRPSNTSTTSQPPISAMGTAMITRANPPTHSQARRLVAVR
jgi:hypothetical protein